MRACGIVALLTWLTVPTVAHAQLQAGWSEHELQLFSAGCEEAIVTPAKADFASAAAKAGDDKAVFPEKELRSSVKEMCACFARRIATAWTIRDWELNDGTGTYLAQLIEEAFAGGRCKPEGLLSEILSRAKSKHAK
jgi:hypothetical protein